MGRDTDESKLEGEASTAFDQGIPAGRGINYRAAAEKGLFYHRGKRSYVDDEGCPQLDRFGQPLG